jgi:CheY-like chemotaxis protein
MDGMALITGLKAIDPDTRIVATTGSPGREVPLANAGVRYVLSKPFTADTLLRAVADALASRDR